MHKVIYEISTLKYIDFIEDALCHVITPPTVFSALLHLAGLSATVMTWFSLSPEARCLCDQL